MLMTIPDAFHEMNECSAGVHKKMKDISDRV